LVFKISKTFIIQAFRKSEGFFVSKNPIFVRKNNAFNNTPVYDHPSKRGEFGGFYKHFAIPLFQRGA